MAQEFEIKLRAPKADVLDRLLAGATPCKKTAQDDKYFDTRLRDLFQRGFFLRQRGNRVQLKHTPDIFDRSHIICEEDEWALPFSLDAAKSLMAELDKVIELPDEISTDFEQLKQTWGLEDFVNIRKVRHEYRKDRLLIFLDDVESLGSFVEIEANDIDGRTSLTHWVSQHKLEHINTGYVELLLQKLDPDTYFLGRFLREDKSNENQPTSHSWTLESELKKITNESSLRSALLSMHVLEDYDTSYIVQVLKDWHRAGAETYQYYFSVYTTEFLPKRLLLKACAVFAVGGTIEDVIDSWLHKRKLLSNSGIPVPTLYARGRGIFVEEYIPFGFWPLLARSHNKSRTMMLVSLAHYIDTLYHSKLHAASPFADLRSRGTDLVPVDYGEDYDSVSQTNNQPREELIAQCIDFANRYGINFTPPELSLLHQKPTMGRH